MEFQIEKLINENQKFIQFFQNLKKDASRLKTDLHFLLISNNLSENIDFNTNKEMNEIEREEFSSQKKISQEIYIIFF